MSVGVGMRLALQQPTPMEHAAFKRQVRASYRVQIVPFLYGPGVGGTSPLQLLSMVAKRSCPLAMRCYTLICPSLLLSKGLACPWAASTLRNHCSGSCPFVSSTNRNSLRATKSRLCSVSFYIMSVLVPISDQWLFRGEPAISAPD